MNNQIFDKVTILPPRVTGYMPLSGHWRLRGTKAPSRSEQAVNFDDSAALTVVTPTKYRFGAVPNYALKPDLPKYAETLDDYIHIKTL